MIVAIIIVNDAIGSLLPDSVLVRTILVTRAHVDSIVADDEITHHRVVTTNDVGRVSHGRTDMATRSASVVPRYLSAPSPARNRLERFLQDHYLLRDVGCFIIVGG